MGLNDVFDQLIQTTFGDATAYKQLAANKVSRDGQIRQMTQQKVLEHLIQLASSKENNANVRATAHRSIMKIKADYATASLANEPAGFLAWMIQQYEANPDMSVATATIPAPDGSPIDPGQEWLEPGCGWDAGNQH